MMDATVEQLGMSFLEREQPLYPLGFGKPQDVASMAAFMLSQEASWLTGQNIICSPEAADMQRLIIIGNSGAARECYWLFQDMCAADASLEDALQISWLPVMA